MKYIFLDIDGVLNTPKSKTRCGLYIGIDYAKVLLLKHIIDKTGAQIVLNSTWKEYWEKDAAKKYRQDKLANYLDEKLQRAGLCAIDKTPVKTDGQYLSRGEGILVFLNTHQWDSFVILDDLQFDYDGCGLTDNFIKTNENTGLTAAFAEKAIEILNK